MLEIKNLSYRVSDEGGSFDILHNINLTIAPQRFLVITGPNGGGKTSLARAIMGIYKPTSGSIFWNGEDITQKTVTERAQRGISYGFQQPPRFKGMKVRDLLEISAGGKISHNTACSFLTKVGLCARDYIDRDVDSSLSGGELKRIEIATVLARRSQLMIFDEPEAGIDLWSFARLTDTFREIHDNQEATILIISHQERIFRLADEILLVANGSVSARGSVEELYPKIMADTVAGCNRLEVERPC